MVCKHCFCVMASDKNCKFHLRLILTRWFKEDIQDMPDIDQFIGKHAFLVANSHRLVGLESKQQPSESYMDGVRSMVSKQSVVPEMSQTKAQRKRQFAEMMGAAKSVISIAQEDQDRETRDDLLTSLDGVMKRRQKRLAASEETSRKEVDRAIDKVKNPVVGKKVGRPRSSRKKGSSEMATSKSKKKNKKKKKERRTGDISDKSAKKAT